MWKRLSLTTLLLGSMILHCHCSYRQWEKQKNTNQWLNLVCKGRKNINSEISPPRSILEA